jgi:formate hydrogenlyase transcriptional activator
VRPAGIFLPDPASEKSRLYALDFPSGKGFIKVELVVSPGKGARTALETLKPVILGPADADHLSRDVYELARAEGIKARCFIPLVNRGRALGVFAIFRRTEDSFTPDDVAFLSQIAGQIAIAVGTAFVYREISELKDKLAQEKLYLEDEISSETNFAQIIGNSSALRKALRQVETVAPTDSTVLIYGGTGKELVARAIHDLSPRRGNAFVKVNCAAIPAGLLESEMFGHERGAFTGAIAQRIGRFEVANGGTIFLDEVGEIPLELQTKLLRVLRSESSNGWEVRARSERMLA